MRLCRFAPIALQVIAAGMTAAQGVAAGDTRPNVIYILADDLGYGDLGCYGQERFETPNIDRLASEGVRFTNHYAGSTVCAPSRACLMTGLHTGHSRVRGNSDGPGGRHGDGVPLLPDDVTLAEVLKGAGYRTGCFGKWGLGIEGTTGEPNKQGFDCFYGFLNQANAHYYYPEYVFRNGEKEPIPANEGGKKGVYLPDRIIEEGLAFIDGCEGKPFFLYWPLITPHAELAAPEDSLRQFAGRWQERPFTRNGSGGDRHTGFGAYDSQPMPRAAFAAMVTRMDADVGRLFAKLKRAGLDENTLVIFSSDNGPHIEGGADPGFFNSSAGLRGHKRDLYEGGIRVPMLARWPGKIAPGSVCDSPCAAWDLLPTLAELCGIDAPAGIDGVSLAATLLGSRQPELDARCLYWEFHERKFSEQAVRQGPWKAIRHGPNWPIELYELDSDPSESRDVSASHPTVVAHLKEHLRTIRTPSDRWPLVGRRK